MRYVGRGMQWIGLALPPLAMLAELTGGIRLGQMLVALVGGVAAFYLGRMLEGYARR